MKLRNSILATAAAGCLAVTLYAAESQAAYCDLWSWWDDNIDHICYLDLGQLRGKASGFTLNGTKTITADLCPAPTQWIPPYGGYWAVKSTGTDSSGNLISGCYAEDRNQTEGESTADSTGCENAIGYSMLMGYWQNPPPG